MTADEAAFLARIREEPDADLPRLVFADYLEEQGYEARAQFIRAQIELASLTDDSPRRRELAWHCRQYIEGEAEADIPEPFRGMRVRFARGLIEYAEIGPTTPETFAELFRLAPLRRVWLPNVPESSYFWEVSPDNCLQTLDVTGNDLWHPISVPFYLTHGTLPRLKELVLTGCEVGDDAIDELCSNAETTGLGRIHLGGNPFTPEGRAELRAHFGDRVTFDCEGDPDRLYAFHHQQYRYAAGFGSDLTQHFVLVGPTLTEVAQFDHAGNLLRMERRPHDRGGDAGQLIEDAILGEFGHSPLTIRVKRFKFAEDAGIFPYPPLLMEELANPRCEDRAEMRLWLEGWLRDGSFCWEWGNDWWLNREGLITST